MKKQNIFDHDEDTKDNTVEQMISDPHQQAFENNNLLPVAWNIAESLTSPDKLIRREAIDRFESIKTLTNSPLIYYLLATRIVDPDIEIRSRVVKIVGELLNVPAIDNEGFSVHQHLLYYVSQMRTRHVYAIIQVYNYQLELEKFIVPLLKGCPYAGKHLMEILLFKGAPMEIRKAAATLIGVVGFIDLASELEKFKCRLEAKLSHRNKESGFHTNALDDNRLLPVIESAINQLNSI